MTKDTIDAIEAALPDTFYAGLPIDRRVGRMADEWRRCLAAIDRLELELIEARNPGIDMAEVRRSREEMAPDAPVPIKADPLLVDTIQPSLGDLLSAVWRRLWR